MEKQPRGIRNNNPLNIRHGSKWKGLCPVQTDKSFCQFISMSYGLRAAFLLIRNYMEGRCADKVKRFTVFSIISKWAPPSENNTSRYVETVCSRAGLLPFQRLQWQQRGHIVDMVRAMAFVECGQLLDKDLFYAAYDMVN